MKTIEECCEKIKSELQSLEICINDDIPKHLDNINQIVDKISELNQEQQKENDKLKIENLYFTTPKKLDIELMAERFGLNERYNFGTNIVLENKEVRFSCGPKVIVVALFDKTNSNLSREIKDYFYKKEWKK